MLVFTSPDNFPLISRFQAPCMARSPGHPLLGIIESISKPPCVIVTYSPLPLSFKQDKKHYRSASSSPGFCDFSFWAAHSQHSRSVLDEAKLTKTPPYRRAHRQRLFISVSLNITLASLVFQPIYLFSANILYSFSVSLHSGLSLHRTTSSHLFLRTKCIGRDDK